MAITQKTIKILWADTAGQCAFSDCREKLCSSDTGEFAPYTIGEMAHICGENPGSNRYDPDQTQKQRDRYANLILLCPNHHTVIDRKENEARYSIEILTKMKIAHEAYVRNRLEVDITQDKHDAVRQIAILLAENHAVWLQYGPFSEIAQKNPHSEDAHAVWISERLSTIVPNNRKIAEILNVSRKLFSVQEQQAISSFLVHERSYERWVQDEISYEAVVRFPQDFDEIIKEAADASA